MSLHIAYISVGSNMGDRILNCRRGISALSRSGASKVVAESRFFQTEPVDYIEQGWFVNGVVKIETRLDPESLLAELRAIEREAGRTRSSIRFGPRLLDLDILFYDDLIFARADLEIPHPRLHKRRFVLVPICDIDKKIMHPVLKKDAASLLDALNDTGQKVIPFS